MTQPTPIAPLRVLPVDYAMPARRPGIITALGTVAIVIACLSLLCCFIAAITSLGFFVRSNLTAAMQTQATLAAQAQARVAAQSANAEVTVGLNGLEPSRRRLIIVALNRLQPMGAQQQSQFDRLLARAGKTIFPYQDRRMLGDSIRDLVSQSGRVPELAGKHSTFFVLGTGKIELHDDRAVFFPSSSEEPTIRVQEGFDENDQPIATANSGTVNFTMPPIPPYKVRGGVLATTILEALASGALAIYLLVVGILVLRQHLGGRTMQFVFAFLKLPLAIVGAIAWMMAVDDHIASLYGPNATGPAPQIWLIILLLAGCAYPIALLIVLSMPAIKKYYRGEEIR